MHHVRRVRGREAERETTGPGESVNTAGQGGEAGQCKATCGPQHKAHTGACQQTAGALTALHTSQRAPIKASAATSPARTVRLTCDLYLMLEPPLPNRHQLRS